MLTLYYFPQLVSMATHIVLEEIGVAYETRLIDVMKGENKQPAYLAINPAGQMPALMLDDGTILTETLAILDYLAALVPDRHLAPTDPLERARWLATMSRIASAMHTAFTRAVRPDLVVDDPAAHDAVKAGARTRFSANLSEMERLATGGEWLLGDQYTTADAHAIVLYNWGVRGKFALEPFANLTRWKDRMLERPAVRSVLQAEGSSLVEAA